MTTPCQYHDPRQQKKADDPPDRDRDAKHNGIRRLRNRVAIDRAGYGAKALIVDIGIVQVMGSGQICRNQHTAEGQYQDAIKISGIRQGFYVFAGSFHGNS